MKFIVSDYNTKNLILDFYKGLNIKQKYIEIINDLREENTDLKTEISEKNAIIELKNKEINNNIYNHINNNVFLGNDIIKKKSDILKSDLSSEKDFLKNKRNRCKKKAKNKTNYIDIKDLNQMKSIMEKAIKEVKNKNKNKKNTNIKNANNNVTYNLRKKDDIEEKEEISIDDESEKFITIE